MRLPALILTFSIFSIHAFAQGDYKLFEYYSNKETRQLHSRLISTTVLEQGEFDNWNKLEFTAFNEIGLPELLINYYTDGKELERKEFHYTAEGHISKIETFRHSYQTSLHFITEFATDLSGRIISCSTYELTSGNVEKLLVNKMIVEYYPNGIMNREIELWGKSMDTLRVDTYDNTGTKILSDVHESGVITRIGYNWNTDKTFMKEEHYSRREDTVSIIHTYKDGKETSRIDTAASTFKFYWKYNNAGWLIETNKTILIQCFRGNENDKTIEPSEFIQYNTYNERGFIKSMTIRNPDPEANVREQPNKWEYKYEYQFRN